MPFRTRRVLLNIDVCLNNIHTPVLCCWVVGKKTSEAAARDLTDLVLPTLEVLIIQCVCVLHVCACVYGWRLE